MMTQPTEAASKPVVAASDLVVRYPSLNDGPAVQAVNGVSFEIGAGETFGIIGESGSGKSTIGRVLVGLQSLSSGSLLHGGRNLQELSKRQYISERRQYQIIFQDPNAALNPRMTILQSMIEPMKFDGRLSVDQQKAKAFDMLARVGLSEQFGHRYPHQLSGGQKQRINIARVLALRPKLIVCDEVVAALDVSIRGEVLNLLANVQSEYRIAYAFISHDIGIVAHFTDRLAVTYLGRFMEAGPTDEIIQKPRHPYTKALLSAAPSVKERGGSGAQRIILKGEIPSPSSPPTGCVFHTRCPLARSRCETDAPHWRALGGNRRVACHYAEE